ncbi:MAG TPA: SDR family oxidoreductase [Fimbriimonadaceae bacterium]|jgi:3-oxoacyl-[acyl-carrier protein] reductase
MDLGIKGRVAMVAAGSKGIGLASARALAAEGCKVSICGRTQETIDKAVSEIGHGAKGHVADVSKLEDLKSWFKQTEAELGAVQILVTNTGGPPAGNVMDLTDEQWEAGVQSTLMNVVRMVRLAAPGMKAAKWGRVIHITSLVAKEPAKFLPISSTLRTGLMSLTKLQAYELAQDGITVNGVLPGHTDTDRQQHLIHVRADKEGISLEESAKQQAETTAMKRFARPEEIGDVVAFLCSERASYISGVSLLVDGATTCAFG